MPGPYQATGTGGSVPASSEQPQVKGLHAELLFGHTGKIIKMLDEVKKEVKDLKLELPKLIVVGQESSGKSSVLERIAMLQFFPRDEFISTRMPTVVRLCHVSLPELEDFCKEHGLPYNAQHGYVRMRYESGDGKEQQNSEFQKLEEVEKNVKHSMEMAVKVRNGDKKGIIDDKLYIEVHSHLIPNLELVDLPGIVSARIEGEPEDMMETSRKLVEKYMQEPHVLVLAVVPAYEHVRNSQAFQLIQKHGLESRTIGVLTMADRAKDVSLRDPYAKLKQKLDGTSQDCPKLPLGYVAVKNRDNRQGILSSSISLQEAAAREFDWFEETLPGYRAKGKATSEVLLTKLSQMVGDYVKKTWLPDATAMIQKEIDALVKARLSLGVDPAIVEAGAMLEKVLKPIADALEKTLTDLGMKASCENELKYDFSKWVPGRSEMETYDRINTFECFVIYTGKTLIDDSLKAQRKVIDKAMQTDVFPILPARFKRLHDAVHKHFDEVWRQQVEMARVAYVQSVRAVCATTIGANAPEAIQCVRRNCLRAIYTVVLYTLTSWRNVPALGQALRKGNVSVNLLEEDTAGRRKELTESIERLKGALLLIDDIAKA